MKRDVEVLSVPFGLGAGRRGSEHGPAAIVEAGLIASLKEAGYKTGHRVIEPAVGMGMASTHGGEWSSRMKHEAEVVAINRQLAMEAAGIAYTGRFPLMLGGDHSLAMGMIAGVNSIYRKLGVIWLDAHADLNSEATSPSGNMHGIPLAVSLNKAQLKLTDLWPQAVPVQAANVALVAARDIDPGEQRLIREARIRLFTMEAIRERGIERVMLEALRVAAAGASGVHLSFDIDSVDPSEAPGTGTAVDGGLSSGQVRAAFGVLRRSGKLVSMDAVEVNPRLDHASGQTAHLTARLVAGIFGK